MQALLLIVIGIVLIIVSVLVEKKTDQLKKNGIKTTGVVFDLESSYSEHTGKIITPIIRFLDSNDNWITAASETGVSSDDFKQGDEVTICYDRENPKNFIIDSPVNKVAINLLLIAGPVMILAGVAKLLGLF